MINQGSRYHSGQITRTPDVTGTYQLTVTRTVAPQLGQFTTYIWANGDRPDLVAQRFYHDPTLWWVIFDANPELIYPIGVPPGTLIRIPLAPVASQGTLNL